ncbi:MAG: hypothetical protein ACK52V_04575 [Betaproteobacteria bacterium]
MPVTAAPAVNRYTGNGVTAVFAYGFRVFVAADLQVLINGVAQASGFTVSGVNAPSGGNVTFTTAPASGAAITLIRSMAYSRSTDYQAGGDLLETTLDADQDAPVMMIQQLAETAARTVRVAVSSSLTNVELAAPVADGLIGWNGTANGLEVKYPTSFPTLAPGVSDAGRIVQVSSTGSLVLSQVPLAVNRVTNGNMQIDQRNGGAAQTITAGAALAYTVDRWYAYCTGANVTGQQVAVTAAAVRYRFTGAASNTGIGFAQRIEAADTYDLASQVVTLQAKLASTGPSTITWALYYANSQDAFGTVASPTRTLISTGSFTSVGSTEGTYSATVTFPAGATTGIEVVFTSGALLGGQTITIGDVQLEVGSVASRFAYVPYDALFARCQRYLPSLRSGSTQSYIGSGQCVSTSQALVLLPFAVDARTRPTGVVVSSGAHFSALQPGGTTTAATTATFNGAGTRAGVIELAGMAGLTAGNATTAFFNNVSGSILFTGCEL